MLKIKVAAAPEKGKANSCLLTLMAKQLGIKTNAIEIVTGQTSAVKKISVVGASSEEIIKKLKL